jgi:S-adenosylmethionine:tRNA ribosyltransferase-isomerase
VYANEPGSVAAPTAGLHFTHALLEKVKSCGVNIGYVTLHIGSGTFKPVNVDNIHEHKMHHEAYHISNDVLELIRTTQNNNGRVIAVGTTSVRVLEDMANRNYQTGHFETDIFITPGFEFKVVDMLITNFHLPKSTLLMLVSAFAGYDEIKKIYQHAIEKQYRFYSYGDAMLLYLKDK